MEWLTFAPGGGEFQPAIHRSTIDTARASLFPWNLPGHREADLRLFPPDAPGEGSSLPETLVTPDYGATHCHSGGKCANPLAARRVEQTGVVGILGECALRGYQGPYEGQGAEKRPGHANTSRRNSRPSRLLRSGGRPAGQGLSSAARRPDLRKRRLGNGSSCGDRCGFHQSPGERGCPRPVGTALRQMRLIVRPCTTIANATTP